MSRHADQPEPEKVHDFVAQNDLATTLQRRGLVVRDRWWRRPPRYLAGQQTVSPPDEVLGYFTDHVIGEMEARGLLGAPQKREPGLLDRMEPLPAYVAGLATALLFVLVLALVVWQVS